MKIVWTEKYLKYDFGKDHPFRAGRALPFFKKLKGLKIPHQIIKPQKADDNDILLVHKKNYLEKVKQLAEINGALSLDTPVNRQILEAAYYSVGGSILALRIALGNEKVINLLGGLHHAGISTSSGFCLFNDAAIAIRKLQKEGKIRKVIIYDLDVHAGNGTSEIFYEDSSVFKISLHQDPRTLYPGTGFSWQRGEKEGKDYNLNIPLLPGTSEKEYLKALDSVLSYYGQYRPDVVVLILGVDTYKDDPLADLKLEEKTYQKIGQRFNKFPKIAVLCAGGYSQKVPDLWLSFVKGFVKTV